MSVARFIQSPSCFAACARSPPLPLTERISIALSVSLQDEQLSSRFCCNLNIQPSSVCCNNSLTVAWDVLNNWTLVKYIWNNSFIERLSMTLKVLIWPWWGGKNCNRTEKKPTFWSCTCYLGKIAESHLCGWNDLFLLLGSVKEEKENEKAVPKCFSWNGL